MLTHRITKRIDLPHEPGEWIEARMPSMAILERAGEVRSKRAIALMDGVDLSRFQGMAAPQGDAGPNYDALTVLQGCIVAWSYADPVTAENVAELDAVTVECVMAVLVPGETEAERKNGYGGSTTPLKAKAPSLTSG